ncbi:Rrf2 family transcriptional regulator [Acidovorax sp. Leaf160]|uniref:Rrf2 family transcriptional regulator n=1 Tax=Acidovorax sp. Leaf160 TaxID=1736280 RepID=UPI0006FC294A|nr:Rrf2 family transcriptional regulator [Acidovorax sp. Leaf160]KQR55366.1 Rrf2 family transcriptional regulator [Acidovorax sp. Leaf160]
MRLTTRGKMAVTAVTDMALRSHGGPVALPGISARQGISLSYLEDIFGALRRAGLVTSIRGPGGGYTLTRRPQELSVAEIVSASEKFMARSPADAAEAASDGSALPSAEMTEELWTSFHSRVKDYLQSITVADLLKQQTVQPGAWEPAAREARPAARKAVRTQLPARNVPNSVFALGQLSSA